MSSEWFMGLFVLVIILISAFRVHEDLRPKPPLEEGHQERNGLLTDEEAILRQLAMGNKINAIKLYRVQTGVGLKEAKRAVEAMQQAKPQAPFPTTATTATYSDDDAIQSMLIAGNKINAIKLYRQRTGLGLKEAKAVIDRMAAGLKEPFPEISNQTERGQVNPEELQRLILAGQNIQAIKYYREATGVGLKEAKEAVDWLTAQMQQTT